jgi:hypothetical protein
MPEDVRDKPFIDHDDVIGLNFISTTVPYLFRRHFRQGLRSHILEVLKPSDVKLEKTGIAAGGATWFPRAKPYKMFRIFRTRLKSLDHAIQEIERVKLVEKYLFPDYLARSNEIIVDYFSPGGRDLVLCGLQEYVEGEILDPWSILDRALLLPAMYDDLCRNVNQPAANKYKWVRTAREKGAFFVDKVKQMICETQHVPDLAGVGNIIMVRSGAIKLVDINNVCRVSFDSHIALDDRGYPVCDKSIEALSIIECKVAGRTIDRNEALYKVFLDPERKKEVKHLEDIFYSRIKSLGNPDPIVQAKARGGPKTPV